jgi:hypothetical protein
LTQVAITALILRIAKLNTKQIYEDNILDGGVTIMQGENRSCREFIEKYHDARINCCTCVKFSRDIGRCADEAAVVKRYEDTPNFNDFKKMMETNKGVVLG